MREKYIKTMLQLAEQAGRISIRRMADCRPQLKPDQSVLTQADTQVSQLVKKGLSGFLNSRDHLLIDEEDGQNAENFDQKKWEKTPYIWIIDPIDGTRAYSNQMPLYGISIGLLKDLRPWLGVIYLPGLKELFYCDGERGFFVKNAFDQNQKRQGIKPVDQKITPQSLFLVSDSLFQLYNWDFDFCQVTLPSCAVIDLCWPAIGRGCGCFFNAHLWDFAGAWPIFRAANLELRSLSKGEVLKEVHTDLFKGTAAQRWRMKEPYLLSSERNYSLIKKHLSFRQRQPPFSTVK